MSPITILVLVTGALLGVAAATLVAALTRRVPVLTDALAALDERRITAPDDENTVRRWWARTVLPLLRRLPARVDAEDLDLLDLPRDRALLGAAGAAVTLAAAGPALGIVLVLIDASLPVVVPAGAGLLGLIVGWTSHLRRLRDRADDARGELRSALVSVLQQVGLLRRGGAGVATAITLPTQLPTGSWAMRRLRDELALAQHAGEMPWIALSRFGERSGIAELTDLSRIAALAGQDGAAVVNTLLARAESLRDELLADEHTAANRASAQMSAPGAIMTFLIAAWVLFPAGLALLTSV